MKVSILPQFTKHDSIQNETLGAQPNNIHLEFMILFFINKIYLNVSYAQELSPTNTI